MFRDEARPQHFGRDLYSDREIRTNRVYFWITDTNQIVTGFVGTHCGDSNVSAKIRNFFAQWPGLRIDMQKLAYDVEGCREALKEAELPALC